jgi:glutamate transport system substrate-binding protein
MMRSTRLVAVLGALTLALSAAACGGDEGGDDTGSGNASNFAAGTTMERINKAQVLRVGTKFDQPGFGLKGLSGKPEGFDVEVAKYIASALDVPEDKIQFTESPSTVREQLIQQDKVDIVVATYTINDKRKEVIDFAGPYYIAGQAILVKADNTDITGPDSFKDGSKKVCSVTNSTPASNIEQYLGNKEQQLVLFDIYQKCIDALKGGQVDAVTTDNVILGGFISTNEGQFKLAGGTFTEEPYGIGLKKGDTAFKTFINEQLTKAFQDGKYQEMWKATAGKFDTSELKTPTIAP